MLLSALFAWSGFAAAATSELPRLTGTIAIDGVLEQGEWAEAVVVDLDVETKPAENSEARVATVAYLIEDGENLYVAFQAEDPAPDDIRAFLRDRDTAWEDDHVGIVLPLAGGAKGLDPYIVRSGIRRARRLTGGSSGVSR